MIFYKFHEDVKMLGLGHINWGKPIYTKRGVIDDIKKFREEIWDNREKRAEYLDTEDSMP
ncbi:MAG: hypothetical protein ABIG67_03045 [Pseudomonadota bacterium]